MTDPSRHLRKLYRDMAPSQIERGGKLIIDQAMQAERDRVVGEEYKRLFPEGSPRLDQILVDAWREGRQLAGQTRDWQMQCWRDKDGRRVD